MDESSDLERLRAERDALAREVDALRAPRRRARRVATGILVAMAWIALAVAPVAVWARAQLLETDRWVEVVAPLGEEPAVQAAIAEWATGELVDLVQPEEVLRRALPDRAAILSVPLTAVIVDFVRGRVDAYLATGEFARLWRAAVERAHEGALRVLEGSSAMVEAGADRVTIDLLPLLDRVLARITSTSPELFGRTIDLPDIQVDDVPPGTAQRLGAALGVEVPDDLGQITLYDEGRLRAAQDGVRVLGRLVTLVAALAVLLPVAALWASADRRRTAVHLALGGAIALVVTRRGVLLLGDLVTERIPRASTRDVADRLLDRLLAPLLEGTAWMVGAGLVLAGACYLAGPGRGAVRTRALAGDGARGARQLLVRGVGAVDAEPAARWVAEHRAGLQAGTVLAVGAVLWLADLGWLSTLVLLAALAGVQVLLARTPGSRPAA